MGTCESPTVPSLTQLKSSRLGIMESASSLGTLLAW